MVGLFDELHVRHQLYLSLVTFDIVSDLYPMDPDLPDVYFLRLCLVLLPADLELQCSTVLNCPYQGTVVYEFRELTKRNKVDVMNHASHGVATLIVAMEVPE